MILARLWVVRSLVFPRLDIPGAKSYWILQASRGAACMQPETFPCIRSIPRTEWRYHRETCRMIPCMGKTFLQISKHYLTSGWGSDKKTGQDAFALVMLNSLTSSWPQTGRETEEGSACSLWPLRHLGHQRSGPERFSLSIFPAQVSE